MGVTLKPTRQFSNTWPIQNLRKMCKKRRKISQILRTWKEVLPCIAVQTKYLTFYPSIDVHKMYFSSSILLAAVLGLDYYGVRVGAIGRLLLLASERAANGRLLCHRSHQTTTMPSPAASSSSRYQTHRSEPTLCDTVIGGCRKYHVQI